MSTHHTSTPRVQALFRASADEIMSLSEIAATLQSLTQKYLNSSNKLSCEDASTLQSLDYLTQSLTALGDVLGEAADHVSPDWTTWHLASLEAMTLTGLKHRLSETQTLSPTIAENGYCDLFD